MNSASERRRAIRFTVISKELLHQCLDIYYPWSSNVQHIPPANDLVRLFMGQAAESQMQVLRTEDLKVLSVRSLVKGLMIKAVHRGAADVCFEPDRTEFRIRFKVEGECEQACTALPPNAGPQILSVIKQWAGVDIAERERTQDGKFQFRIELRPEQFVEYRFRVAITPTIHGEECTIRLLENSSNRKRIDSLKADPRTLDHLWRVVNTRRGFILMTGPTGSGKTTTLAAILSECDATKERIITIEDPVEIPLDGIAQTQVNEKKGESYERLVRNALRRSPDRILIGEIRDNETAHYAIKASLTGHQVLATVHADYAVQVVARMLMEGTSPFNLASTLTLVVAQRLMNLLCEHCAVPVTYDDETLLREQFTEAELRDIQAREGRGCAMCNFKGTKGRTAIYETMVITDELKSIINSNRPDLESALDAAAVRGGMRPLRRSALDMVKCGRISLAQVVELCRPMTADVYEAVRDTVSQSVAIEDFGFDPNSTGEWAPIRNPVLGGYESDDTGDRGADAWRALPPATDDSQPIDDSGPIDSGPFCDPEPSAE
ncbi:MAG: GspE/PulE family protein, partial [Blastocatellia bacterium]